MVAHKLVNGTGVRSNTFKNGTPMGRKAISLTLWCMQQVTSLINKTRQGHFGLKILPQSGVSEKV